MTDKQYKPGDLRPGEGVWAAFCAALMLGFFAAFYFTRHGIFVLLAAYSMCAMPLGWLFMAQRRWDREAEERNEKGRR